MSILVFLHSDLSGADRLADTLRDRGQPLRFVNLHEGDTVPPDLDGVDGIVTCGAPSSATDDSVPWIAGQMELLRAAHEVEMPIVGLCFGCQILARALGGTVAPMTGGIEFGWHEVALKPAGREDAVHAGIAWWSPQFMYHRHEVTELPPGGRLLASSDKCRVQAFVAGVRSYGFQYHPEIDVTRIPAWMDDEPAILEEAGLTRAQVEQQTEELFPAFARLTERLFESIADCLMPVDRRYAGIVKDLHH